MFQRATWACLLAVCLISSTATPILAEVPIIKPKSELPVDLLFDSPAPITDIYRAVAKAFGLQPVFDPDLRNVDASIQLQQTSFTEAMDTLSRLHGHIWVPLGDTNFLIAPDTPQNRRLHEPLVVRSYTLQNADLASIMTMIRSITSAKHVAADSGYHRLTVRDGADKIALIDRLVAAHDVPSDEVEITVEVVEIPAQQIKHLGSRPPTDRLESQLAGTPRLLGGKVSVIGEAASSISLDQKDGNSRHLSAELRSRVHAAREEVTIRLQLALAGGGRENPSNQRTLDSAWRVEKGHSVLIELPATAAENGASRLAIVLTPEIIRSSRGTEMPALWVGTESHLSPPQTAE